MKALRTLLLCGLALAALAGTSSAGGSMLAIQITGGDGDYVSYEGGFGDLPTRRHPEVGVQAQYWYLWSADYAVAVAAGIGFARETTTPGVNAFPGDPAVRDLYSSWQVRVGGDRIGKINDTFRVYAGPGLQVWGGKVEVENDGTTVGEGPTALRWAVDGRVGTMLNWGESFGMVGHVGHYWGYSSAEQARAEAKVLSSGLNGAMGVFFSF